jgi:hypothetical protein
MAEYVPAVQCVQAAVPVVGLYVPAAHVEHIPSGPVYPGSQGSHIQELMDELAMEEVEPAGHARHVSVVVAAGVAEYMPAAQSAHTALPVVVLYLPATHAVHVPPFGPEKPALQVHTNTVELASGELELVGHARHVVATVAASVVEYVPAAQSTQLLLRYVTLYFPAVQAVHGPPFGPS